MVGFRLLCSVRCVWLLRESVDILGPVFCGHSIHSLQSVTGSGVAEGGPGVHVAAGHSQAGWVGVRARCSSTLLQARTAHCSAHSPALGVVGHFEFSYSSGRMVAICSSLFSLERNGTYISSKKILLWVPSAVYPHVLKTDDGETVLESFLFPLCVF